MRYLLLILSLSFFAPSAFAQQKLDLDDVSIKGELHSDNRLRFYARQRNQLKNYVKFRTNYRDVIGQEIPKEFGQMKRTPSSSPKK